MLLLRLSKIHGLVGDCVLKLSRSATRRIAMRSKCVAILQKSLGLAGIGQAGLVNDALRKQEEETIHVTDDYGRKGELRVAEIAAAIAGDFAASLTGNVDAAILQTRAQAEGHQRVMADPKLKFMAQMAMPANGGFKL